MARDARYSHTPDYATPPGETLRQTIDDLGMTQADLALRVGLSAKTINQIIQGEHPLSQKTAILLERATGVPARMWNNLEMQYQERRARKIDREDLNQQLSWLKTIPCKELVRLGAIPGLTDPVDMLRAALAFFGVGSPAEWESYWKAKAACQFRKSDTFEMKPGVTAAWIRLGELEAQQIECATYNEKRFLQSLQQVRTVTTEPVSTWKSRLIDICAPAGVAVVLVPEIKGCPASGVTQWLTPEKALIQLSLRYKKDDHFWFTFFHEAGHILHDSKKAMIIEDGGESDEREEAANRFASDFLIPPRIQSRLRSLRGSVEIERFAAEIGIAPGIVVGQMQKREIIPYSWHNKMKRTLQWRE